MSKKIKRTSTEIVEPKITIQEGKKTGSFPFIFVSIIAFTIAFVIVYVYIFDKKIDLSGDSLAYYFLGKNIFKGLGYVNTFTGVVNPENHFPPGYPFLIAIMMFVGVKSYVGVKIVNGLFFFGSLILSFFVIKKLTDDWKVSLITVLFTALNSYFLYFSFITMSEIPFMFFCMLAILVLLNINKDYPLKDWKFYVLILIIILTYYIRSAGLAMVISVIIFFLLRKKWIASGAILVSFILGALPWYLRNKAMGGNVYINVLFYKQVYNPELGLIDFGGFLQRIWENFSMYVTTEVQNGLFSFLNRQKLTGAAGESYGIGVWIFGLVMLALIFYGLFMQKKYQGFLFWYLATSGDRKSVV